MINEIVYNEDTELLDSPMKPEQLRLLPGAAEAVRKLKKAGFYVFIVTNQPAAAKGKTTFGKLCEINRTMREAVADGGEDPIDEIFMCPHFPEEQPLTREHFLIKGCTCRKPQPGLILRAREKYRIDPERSYMVGDSFTDVLCGRAAGVKTVFIGSYKCDVCARLGQEKPDMIAGSLEEFAGRICGS